MSQKFIVLIVFILWIGSISEVLGYSDCPRKCQKSTRRMKFRCLRLFENCKLERCVKTFKNGRKTLGFICTERGFPLIKASPSPIFILGPKLPKNKKKLSYPPFSPKNKEKRKVVDDILEESIEPESSSEYETDAELPNAPTLPDMADMELIEDKKHTSILSNFQPIANPFQNFATKENPHKIWKKILNFATVHALFEKSLRKQEQETFYEEDKKNGKKKEIDSGSLPSHKSETNLRNFTLEAHPKIVRLGEPNVVKLSIKMDKGNQVDGLESLLAFPLDSKTQKRTGICVELADDGTSIYFDDDAEDNVFTGVFAIKSDLLNEQIDFEVVPVIDGVEKKSHPLSFVARNVISSYGTHNPTADDIEEGLPKSPRIAVIDSLNDLQLKVYFIHFSGMELLSGVQFMQDVVGIQCDESENSNLLMDFKDEGNVQTVTIDMDSAMKKGILGKSASIQLRAGYKKPVEGSPILIISVLENKKTKTTLNDSRLATPIMLGKEEDCPTEVVAKISIYVGEKTAVILRGTSMQNMDSNDLS